jgi:hypothetical protein
VLHHADNLGDEEDPGFTILGKSKRSQFDYGNSRIVVGGHTHSLPTIRS